MTHRTIAIGDIHGHLAAFDALLDQLKLKSEDTLVLLGDYIDRGPHSKQVIDRIIDLSKYYRVISIRGNHEEMMLKALENEWFFNTWMGNGGDIALESYGGRIELIPDRHLDFLENLPLVHEVENHFFIHASFTPNRTLDDQMPADALWGSAENVRAIHFSGKVAIVGHTPQFNLQILDREYLKCLDTACGFGGRLTAYEIMSGNVWQVTEMGEVSF
jgi:serine/threonine protein phosphatase 1